MIKNKQLFRQEPDFEFVNKLIKCFNIKDLNDTRQFCKYDLQIYKTTDKIKELIPEMSLYYVPCKSIAYLSEIDEKRSITILKHFISIYNYTLSRKEIIKKNKKIIYYNISSIQNNKVKIFFENNKRIINFD
jgi:hypothetical protein